MARRIPSNIRDLLDSGGLPSGSVADLRGAGSVAEARTIIAGYRPAGEPATATSGGSSSGGSSSSGGAGSTEPAANVLSLTPLDLDTPTPWELPDVPETDVSSALEASDAGLDTLDSMLQDLRDINSSRLRGEIPDDVADEIRNNSAAGSLALGLGGDSPAARALQAKDLGLTSLDIQDRGIATETTITQLQGDLAKLRENRFQFMQQLEETRRTFQEQSRQFGATLEQDQLRTDIAHKELLARQDMFNASQNLALVEMISRLTMSQAQAQVTAAINDVGDSAITQSYDSLISQIGALIRKSNPEDT